VATGGEEGARVDDVAVVESVLKAVAAGELDSVEELIDPEATFDWSNSIAPYAGVYRGHEEIRRGFEENLFSSFERVEVEVERVVELGGGRLVFGTHGRARGRGGIEVDARGGQLWHVREDRIVYGKLFQSFEEALAAAEAGSGE
jgi:ketosteroid isomerase-like protein